MITLAKIIAMNDNNNNDIVYYVVIGLQLITLLCLILKKTPDIIFQDGVGKKDLKKINETLSILNQNQITIMGNQQKLDESLQKLDEATSEVANDLQALKDELAKGGVSDASIAKLDANIERLQAMGKDPANPDPNNPANPNG